METVLLGVALLAGFIAFVIAIALLDKAFEE